MNVPDPPDLLESVRALPAAGPLVKRLRGRAGVYLVGGAVRDLMLGGRPFDLDLVVEGDAAAFAASLGGRLRIHDRFGTSTVTLDGFSYDIARARRESYAHPGALPDVAPAPLDEDLLRRDFTVNTLAVALGGEHPGELHYATGALEDLEARRLRVLHDGSFIDDPTRMLRLARYAGRLGFSIEPHTRELVDAGALGSVSGPRIGRELRLLAGEDDPVAALEALRELELDRALHPRFGLEDDDLARRALRMLPADGRSERLILGLAGRGVPEAELRTLLDELAFEASDREAILGVATRSDHLAHALAHAGQPSEIAEAASAAEPELVAVAGALGAEDQALEWLERLRDIRLEIDGADLLSAGVPEGPAIGRGLRAALKAKLDGHAAGRDQELEQALQAADASR